MDRSTAGWGMFLGLWGVASGVALFLTWDAFWRFHPWHVLWELPVAAAAAGVAEWAKARVEGHHESSIAGSILILIVLEFFLLGWHGPLNVEMGHLKEISRRMLGEASATRPAKIYAFDIPSPPQLRQHLVMAERAAAAFSTPAPPAIQDDTCLPKEPALIGDHLLRLQPPGRRRLILDGQTQAPLLDFELEHALNAGIRSVDFYRFVTCHDRHAPEEEDAHGLPPRTEMERINRLTIETAFPGMIATLPEAAQGEWLNLALGFLPVLAVGVVLGLVIVRTVVRRFHDTDVNDPNAMAKATVKGLGVGALAGFGSAFLGFFAWVVLVRLAYRLLGGSLLPEGWLVAPFTVLNAELELSVEAAMRAALLFVLPGATLGAIAPWLKPPSSKPQFWSGIALVAAVLAVLASLYSGGWYWWIAVAPFLAVIIVRAIRANKTLDFYWPVGALVVALFVCAITVSAQVTLGEALAHLHLFIQRPADPSAAIVANRREGGGVTTRSIEELARSVDATTRLAEYQKDDDWVKAYTEDRAREKSSATAIGQALEVSLVGGLGFWVTIAALIAWKRQRDAP